MDRIDPLGTVFPKEDTRLARASAPHNPVTRHRQPVPLRRWRCRNGDTGDSRCSTHPDHPRLGNSQPTLGTGQFKPRDDSARAWHDEETPRPRSPAHPRSTRLVECVAGQDPPTVPAVPLGLSVSRKPNDALSPLMGPRQRQNPPWSSTPIGVGSQGVGGGGHKELILGPSFLFRRVLESKRIEQFLTQQVSDLGRILSYLTIMSREAKLFSGIYLRQSRSGTSSKQHKIHDVLHGLPYGDGSDWGEREQGWRTGPWTGGPAE